VRQGKLTPSTGERLVIAATITDTHFGPFKIERHGKQETIRFKRPDGSRPRIPMADLRALAGLLMEAGQDEEHSILYHRYIEILPQNRCNPQNSVKAPAEEEVPPGDIPGVLPQNLCNPQKSANDPLADIPGILPQNPGETQNSVKAYTDPLAEPERPRLNERIAALKLAQNPVPKPNQYPPGDDPLNDLPL